MQRKASAVWQGGLKDGQGSISTDSGVLKQTQYSFSTRFENGVGTNPEELLAAAHAEEFPHPELPRNPGQRILVDDEGPELRKLALICSREPFHQAVAHQEVNHGVPKKLQAFVIDDRLVAVLIAVALVRQSRESKAWFQLFDAQALLEDDDSVAHRSFHAVSFLSELPSKRLG